jgi:DMSO reductase family type II enzyme chaperone
MDTSGANQHVGEIDAAYCRATLYGALALGFRPPNKTTLARIIEPGNATALTDAATFLDETGKWALVPAIENVARAGQADIDILDSSYRVLFGHTARGAVPPYETEYGNEALFQQPQELGDLMGFYHAFGLMVRGSEHERADHISCECEFLSFLAMKEAYALEHRDAAMLDQTIKAEKLFLRDHLGRFLPTFARQLIRENAAGFYAQLAHLCLHFLSQETERLAVRLGAVNLPLRPAEDDRVPMACGNGAECATLPGACAPEGADSV